MKNNSEINIRGVKNGYIVTVVNGDVYAFHNLTKMRKFLFKYLREQEGDDYTSVDTATYSTRFVDTYHPQTIE